MQGKKRKATSQLSPHTADEESCLIDVNAKSITKGVYKSSPQAKSNFSYGGKFANIFSGEKLFPDLHIKEKALEDMSSLNSCFLRSVNKVLSKDSSKDLSFLFKQYSDHLNKILDKKQSQKE